MRLVTFADHEGARAGLLVDDAVIDVQAEAPTLPASTQGLLERWSECEPMLRDLLQREPSVYGFELRPPVTPRRVLATGTNYRDHVTEMSVEAPPDPSCFLKLPGSVCGPEDAIALPADCECVDYEAETAIVIGHPVRCAGSEEALEAIAGLTLANDVSCRDLPLSHIVLAKGCPTFCPLGPAIVTLDEFGLEELSFELLLNGERRQLGEAGMMVRGFGELVASFSQALELEPGDVILTGSPSGVGVAADPPRFLRPGDVVEVTSPQLGELRNRVEA
jgi:2-keto-4-pentenoate hydratase/2-oxohepta-3-ene-1,7-dioic acid hydratase in catechol pathway